MISCVAFGLAIVVGSYFEEMEIMKVASESYSEFRKLIPNKYIPDLNIFFKEESEIEAMRDKIKKHH